MSTPNPESTGRRVELEDALKAACALENAGVAWHGGELARSLGLPEALAQDMAKALTAFGWAERSESGSMSLTETGQARAVELIRAHRLWERYLVDREGVPPEAAHTEAHHREHEMLPDEVDRLDAELGHPAWGSHGDAIPGPGSQPPSPAAQSLLNMAVPGRRLRIVELDDEPAELVSQLAVLGLKPGIDVEIAVLESDLLRLRIDGHIIPLAHGAARHVLAVPAPAQLVPLGSLPVASRAQVIELVGSGKLQRRMLSMGFVPGAEVTVIREAPLGDPRQYRVKKANIALRRNEANTLLVRQLCADTPAAGGSEREARA